MEAINNFTQLWWQWMSSMLWQVSLLIVIIGVLDFFIRKWAWPQVRYALWLLILIKLLIPPTWSMRTSIVSNVQPRVQEEIIRRFPMPTGVTGVRQTTKTSAPVESETQQKVPPIMSTEETAETPTVSTQPAMEESTRPTWHTITFVVWLLGMLAIAGLLIGRMMLLRHWHKQQEKREIPKWFHELLVKTAQQFDISRLPAIVFNDKVKTPAVYGMFRPVMLLPQNYFDNLSEEEAQHVLLHELAHLKRGDLWLHGLTLFMQIIYWFNPLLIWVRRQMKHVREICCDLTVANVLRDKTPAYRMTLLNTARELLTETVEPGLGMLGVFEEPFRLVTRLKWLEKKTWEHRKKIIVAAFAVSLMVGFSVLPMAGIPFDEFDLSSETVEPSDVNVFANAPKKLEQEERWTSNTFSIKMTNELYAAVLIKTGDPDDQFEAAIRECRDLLNKQRIRPLGDPFFRIFSDTDEIPREQWYWEIGFQIKKYKKIKPPLESRRVVPMQVASLGVAGVKDTQATWDIFVKNLDENGYVPCYPPAMEIYRGQKYDEPMWQYTELQIPVKQKGSGYPGINIEFRTPDEITAVVLPVHGSTGQFEEKYQEFKKHLRKNGIKPAGKIFAQYNYDWSESVPNDWDWLIGCPIEKRQLVQPPLEIRQFPSTEIAATFLKAAPQAEYPWSPFVYELIFSGYIPSGPAIEIWDDIDAKETRVEMQIPVMRIPGWDPEMPAIGADEEEWEAWGEKVGQETETWALGFANDLVTSLTGHTIDELNEQNTNLMTLRDKVQHADDVLAHALINQDIETYAKYVADEIIVNPPLHSELQGKTNYLEMMRDDIRRGVKFHTFNSQIMQVWQCGDDIYEIGSFAFSITTKESSQPWVANGHSFTIWQEIDGQLKVAYTIYTTETHPNIR